MNDELKKTKEELVETPKRIMGERKDVGEKVLASELGEKYLSYRKDWIRASERELVTDFPLYLQIEHTGKCNLQCVSCIQGIPSLREGYSKGFKPFDMNLYVKILEEAKKHDCPSISFHNNDEPLLLLDLEERIRMAKEAGFIDIIMTTNANLLSPERTDNLLKSGLTKINFSVDACNEDTYKKIRIGGDFNAAVRNIEYFAKQRNEAGLKLPIMRATCVLNKITEGEKEQFEEFWSKRVDMVEFQNFQAIKGCTEELRPEGARIDDSFVCNAPWQQLVIRANGDVLPCCSFYAAPMVIGNVSKDSLSEIWQGQKMKTIREELFKNNFGFNPICKKCSETFYI